MLGGHILMRTIFRVSILGLVIAAFSAVSAFAQTTTTTNPCDDAYEVKNPIYEKFRANNANTTKSPRTVAKAKIAIQTGEEFVSKYGTCEADKAVVDFIKEKLPELKAYVRLQELYTRFNNSIADIKNVNADEAYSSGKEIMNLNPALAFDVAIVLAQVGFDSSVKTPPVDKFNGEALNFAKKTIKDVEGGKTSDTYGAKVYQLVILDGSKKPDHAKSKQNVLGWMNYMIGSIMYYNQKATKEAVPYFYQTTKFESPHKNKPEVYQAIGAWYVDELLEIDKKRLAAITANGEKDNDETLAMFALIKGYIDRAIDAYARAHKLAKADTKISADYTKGLYDKLQGLYKLRFDKTDGMDAHFAAVTSKPMPDPTTPVTPVVEATTATTTTPSTTKPATTDTTTKPVTTDTTTKPATTTTKPADTTTKPATTTKPTSTTTTKPAASSKTATKSKVTTTKKKGTR